MHKIFRKMGMQMGIDTITSLYRKRLTRSSFISQHERGKIWERDTGNQVSLGQLFIAHAPLDVSNSN